MELLKALLDLLSSFFKNSTAKKVEEVKVSDAVEIATVEKIRATENVVVIQEQQKIQESLEATKQKQKETRVEENKKDLDSQLDDEFGAQ